MPRVFVYGAQMQLARDDQFVGGARVADHAVRFVARGLPVFEPGFAALEPEPGEVAYGALLDLDDAAWADMQRFEQGYRVATVRAERLADASTHEAFAFCIPEALRAERELPPSARYARKLVAGARRAGLPSTVLARYEALAAAGPRWSLALAWLFPIAARIGLVPLALCLGGLVAGLGVWLFA